MKSDIGLHIAKVRIIERHISKAWESLLNDHDSLLLGMLAKKVEDIINLALEVAGPHLRDMIQAQVI